MLLKFILINIIIYNFITFFLYIINILNFMYIIIILLFLYLYY